MKTIRIQRIWVIIPVLLSLMIAVKPALAKAPYQDWYTLDDHYTVTAPCSQLGYAEDITIAIDNTGTWHYLVWDDKNGGFKQVEFVYPAVKSTWSYQGKTLKANIQGPVHFKPLVDGHTQISLGTSGFLTIPGAGLVSGWAGRAEWEVRFTDDDVTVELIKWVGVKAEDWGAVCKYFLE
jgi:hypothetical protein